MIETLIANCCWSELVAVIHIYEKQTEKQMGFETSWYKILKSDVFKGWRQVGKWLRWSYRKREKVNLFSIVQLILNWVGFEPVYFLLYTLFWGFFSTFLSVTCVISANAMHTCISSTYLKWMHIYAMICKASLNFQTLMPLKHTCMLNVIQRANWYSNWTFIIDLYWSSNKV